MPDLTRLAVPAQMLLATLCAFLLAQPAQAEAPQQRRFQLSIELARQGEMSHGAERSRQRLAVPGGQLELRVRWRFDVA